jgi:hypothetical protein
MLSTFLGNCRAACTLAWAVELALAGGLADRASWGIIEPKPCVSKLYSITLHAS